MSGGAGTAKIAAVEPVGQVGPVGQFAENPPHVLCRGILTYPHPQPESFRHKKPRLNEKERA